MLLASKCFIMLLCMICSIILHAIDVSDTGLSFAAMCLSPYLKMGTTQASLQSWGTAPMSVDLR